MKQTLPDHGKGERFCNCNLCFTERQDRERRLFGMSGVDQLRALCGVSPRANGQSAPESRDDRT